MKKNILFTLALTTVLGFGFTSCEKDKVSINKTWELSGEMTDVMEEFPMIPSEGSKLILDLSKEGEVKLGVKTVEAMGNSIVVSMLKKTSEKCEVEKVSDKEGKIYVINSSEKKLILKYANLSKKTANFTLILNMSGKEVSLTGEVNKNKHNWIGEDGINF